MLETLQALRPQPFAQYGYSFRVVHGTDSDAVLKQIAQWIAYENGTYGGHMAGHPYHVLAVIPAYGDYSHWMAVRGIRTNEPAYPLPANLIVWGLYLNDPLPGGQGEYFFATTYELASSYYYPLATNDAYNGEYVAIVGMPNQADIPAVSEWGLIVMTLLMLTSGTLVYQRRVPATM